MRRVSAWLVLALLGACDGVAPPPPRADAGPPVPPAPETIGPPERPAALIAPDDYDARTPLPAVILLHGYGATGAAQDAYFRLSRAARREGFYVVLPDGTVGANGRRFWNATPACCDFGGLGVDDVGYLTGLIDALEAAVPVAEGGVFLLGHSNGGFMSYRMACERSRWVDGIVSVAGSDFAEANVCVPATSVPVLQIHGDADGSILYEGAAGYPSAPDVVARWAARNGCVDAIAVGAARDLERDLEGDETEVAIYASCASQTELWTIVGGAHRPRVTRDFPTQVLAWMRARLP